MFLDPLQQNITCYLHLLASRFDRVRGTQLRKHIDATLGCWNLREAVKLPPGEDFKRMACS